MGAPFENRFYNVRCDFTDGTQAVYEYMSLSDTLAIIATFDTLDVTKCTVEVAP